MWVRPITVLEVGRVPKGKVRLPWAVEGRRTWGELCPRDPGKRSSGVTVTNPHTHGRSKARFLPLTSPSRQRALLWEGWYFHLTFQMKEQRLQESRGPAQSDQSSVTAPGFELECTRRLQPEPQVCQQHHRADLRPQEAGTGSAPSQKRQAWGRGSAAGKAASIQTQGRHAGSEILGRK